MYTGMTAFLTTNLFSKTRVHRYLYHDDLALYSGVLFTVSNVKKAAYRPPVALCTFLRAVKSRLLLMCNSKSKPGITLGLIIKPAQQDAGPDNKITMIVKLLVSILRVLLK